MPFWKLILSLFFSCIIRHILILILSNLNDFSHFMLKESGHKNRKKSFYGF